MEKENNSHNHLKRIKKRCSNTDYPISVFLDTNIFIACKYNMSEESQLGILLRYIKAGKIKLFLSNIVKREVEAHICEDAEQAVGCFQKAVKDAKKCIAEKSIAKSSLCASFNLPTKECVADELKEMFEQYLSDCNAIILDNQGITCDAILNDYFSGTAPFENREKKKHEFPDAIMIAKLKKEFPEGKILWVISVDEGFKQALKGNAQFRCLSRLQELYNLINKNDLIYQEIEKYFSSSADQIHSIILKALESSDIEVDGTECDRKGTVTGFEYDETEILQISNLKIHFDSVDEISESNAIVTIRCSAHFFVYGSYDDFDDGIWDSEDKEYVFVPHYSVYEDHETDFYCELNMSFQEETPNYSFTIDSVKSDIKLDQYSRKKQEIEDPAENAKADQMDALEEYYRH